MDLLQLRSWWRVTGIVPKPRNSFSATQMTSATLSKSLSYGLAERLQQANKTSGGWRDIIDKL
jgi:hypothetical protein